ncbi:MAG: T9SS type A sorting domain-containing protein, partial [Owenweeksia sp.]
EVSPWSTNVVMAGFANEHSGDGGLFISEDAGTTWNQILIDASSSGSDVDVYDIIFTDTNTAYVGVGYDLAAPTGRSIYKVVHDPSTSTISVTQDMNSSGTASGSSITAQVFDLELSPGGDTLFAAGTDAGANHPICYYKDLSGTGKWEVISTSGFPNGSNDVASAVTIGDGVVFCAVNNDIYTYDISIGTGWVLGYSYPIGTAINFLFYDELLVGTGTGLYAQDLNGVTGIFEKEAGNAGLIANLYPNPGKSYIHLQLRDVSLKLGGLKLFNHAGIQVPIVISEKDEQQALLNVKRLKPGMYFVEIQVNELTYLQRFIKE